MDPREAPNVEDVMDIDLSGFFNDEELIVVSDRAKGGEAEAYRMTVGGVKTLQLRREKRAASAELHNRKVSCTLLLLLLLLFLFCFFFCACGCMPAIAHHIHHTLAKESAYC